MDSKEVKGEGKGYVVMKRNSSEMIGNVAAMRKLRMESRTKRFC